MFGETQDGSRTTRGSSMVLFKRSKARRLSPAQAVASQRTWPTSFISKMGGWSVGKESRMTRRQRGRCFSPLPLPIGWRLTSSRCRIQAVPWFLRHIPRRPSRSLSRQKWHIASPRCLDLRSRLLLSTSTWGTERRGLNAHRDGRFSSERSNITSFYLPVALKHRTVTSSLSW